MSNKALRNLKKLAPNPFPENDVRHITMQRRIKRAYNSLSSFDRHPARLEQALTRAIANMTS